MRVTLQQLHATTLALLIERLFLMTQVKGTKENLPCSGRGLCAPAAYSTALDGECDCFDNFESSNGLGGIGLRGDCGSPSASSEPSACPGNGDCNGHGVCNATTFACACSTVNKNASTASSFFGSVCFTLCFALCIPLKYTLRGTLEETAVSAPAQLHRRGLCTPVPTKPGTKATWSALGLALATESRVLALVQHGSQGLLATPWRAGVLKDPTCATGTGSV